MNTSVEKVTEVNEHVFRKLWQYLGYDFSEMNGMTLNEEGHYDLPGDYHEYHESEQYASYIIRVNSEICGLAVIKFLDGGKLNYFRHYFILRKYRGLKIGETVAHKIFDLYTGPWRVSQFDYNEPAIKFWRKTVNNYTAGNFIENRRSDGRGPQQEFG